MIQPVGQQVQLMSRRSFPRAPPAVKMEQSCAARIQRVKQRWFVVAQSHQIASLSRF
jgi:hypothetical protein